MERQINKQTISKENLQEQFRKSGRGHQLKKSAFTLIELIVVMAVIGILVLLAAPKFLGYTQKAQETKHIHTAKVIETALEAYLVHGGEFPKDLEIVDNSVLTESISSNSIIGVEGYISTPDGETYYELTHDFIKKLDVKLSANNNQVFFEAMASSVPTAIYASEKGIALVNKSKTLKGYELQQGEIPNEINPNEIKDIQAGTEFSLALLNDGTLYSWGNNGIGQLGLGDNSNRLLAVTVPLDSVIKISTFHNHVLALKRDGSVWAWGWNNNGQLGNGITVNTNIPIQIIDKGIVEIAAGGLHSLALKDDGSLLAWGSNINGQLGNGSNVNSIVPIPVLGIEGVAKISAGENHSFAVKTNGDLWGWGQGYLGDGGPSSYSPRNLGITDVEKILASVNYSIMLKKDGSVWTWGMNTNGNLGNNTFTQSTTPIKIMEDSKNIGVGRGHTLAIKNNGSLWTWGKNDIAQLGNGSTTNSRVPVQIFDSGVRLVTGGGAHTLAIKEDTSIWAWGSNGYGSVGDGTKSRRTTPVEITIE